MAKSVKVGRGGRSRQAAFLAAFRDSGTLSGAARTADVGLSSHYRWIRENPEYRARFEEANDEAADALEQEARRRALDGVEEANVEIVWDPPWHQSMITEQGRRVLGLE